MKNNFVTVYSYLFISITSIYIFLHIGNIYYLHSNSQLIITINANPTIEKTIFWPHNAKKESICYDHIKSKHPDYIELTGQYNIANLAYIPFIISIVFLIKIFFLLFENNFIRCRYSSLTKHFISFLLTIFFIYAFNSYLYIGDIFDSTSSIHVKFNHPIFIKGFVYTYTTDSYDYNIDEDSIKKYTTETGSSSPDDGVSTQTIFNIITIFIIYYIFKWFYIVRNIFYNWRKLYKL